ncbi:MAG: DUF1361 domain-containing protein [Anaerolineae bacterium]|nr:MAG: DUF1361 domain-containing protein [Anaerolineae bacterium]
MIERWLAFLTRNRYKIAVFALLTAASVFCVMLVAARVAYSDSARYTNLVWNLFLAWIPFLLAYVVYALSWRRFWLYFAIPTVAFLWLIFYPNAPYILTDLQHLATYAADAPLWFDVILLVWFSWTGLLLGLVSLYLMHEVVHRNFGRLAGWLFVFAVSALSSVGLYLGRFARWNSWDLLQNPSEVAMDILGWVVSPNLRLLAFATLFTLFFLFAYLTLYAFGHLLREGEEGTAPHRLPWAR